MGTYPRVFVEYRYLIWVRLHFSVSGLHRFYVINQASHGQRSGVGRLRAQAHKGPQFFFYFYNGRVCSKVYFIGGVYILNRTIVPKSNSKSKSLCWSMISLWSFPLIKTIFFLTFFYSVGKPKRYWKAKYFSLRTLEFFYLFISVCLICWCRLCIILRWYYCCSWVLLVCWFVLVLCISIIVLRWYIAVKKLVQLEIHWYIAISPCNNRLSWFCAIILRC